MPFLASSKDCGKLAVIGFGTMGLKITKAILRESLLEPKGIIVSGRRAETLGCARSLGAAVAESSIIAAQEAQVVLLCTKQLDGLELLREIGSYLDGKILISIAAEVSAEAIGRLAAGAQVVRAMPANSETCSFTALCAGQNAGWEAKAAAEAIFRSMGEITWVQEEKMTGHTIFLSCMQGVFAKMGEQFASLGPSHGWTADETEKAVAWAMRAASEAVLSGGRTFEETANGVATKGGMTARAFEIAQEAGLGGILRSMVDYMFAKAAEIAAKVEARLQSFG